MFVASRLSTISSVLHISMFHLFLGFLEFISTKHYMDGIVYRIFPSFKVFIGANNLFKTEYQRTFHLWERNFLYALKHFKNINLSSGLIIICTRSLCVLLFWDLCTFA